MSDNEMRDVALVMGGYAGHPAPPVQVAIRVWRRLYATALVTNGSRDWAAADLVGRAIARSAHWNRKAAA